jgi:hypothetical protein
MPLDAPVMKTRASGDTSDYFLAGGGAAGADTGAAAVGEASFRDISTSWSTTGKTRCVPPASYPAV